MRQPRTDSGWFGRGFTLIELLVVIALIAVLIAILLPSLGSARALGRQTKCSTQQKQIIQSLIQYSMDNEEYHHQDWQNSGLRFRFAGLRGYYLLPPNRENSEPNNWDADPGYWGLQYDEYLGAEIHDSMYDLGGLGDRPPYLNGWEQFTCPDSKFMVPDFFPSGDTFDPWQKYATYAFNGITPGYDGVSARLEPAFFERRYNTQYNKWKRVPRRIGQIQFPSSILAFQDGAEVMLDGNGDTLNNPTQWDARYPVIWREEFFRHLKSVNAAWADGHVSSLGHGSFEGNWTLYVGFDN